MNRFGQRIKLLRTNLGISQQEVADYLGIHRPSISQIEHGEREISAHELIKLSRLFNVRPEAIVNNQISTKNQIINEILISFHRHGEAIDDIYDEYGGWADPELSPKGVTNAYNEAKKMANNKKIYDIVFTSPLKRARKKAEIFATELKIDIKVLAYLIERNTYGILNGLNKEVAKKMYPEIVKSYENGDYVLGSERVEDFLARIPLLFNYIRNQNFSNVICITHGKMLTGILESILNKNVDKLEEDCSFEVAISYNFLTKEYEKPYLKSYTGISFAS